MRITLLRHGRPDIEWERRVSGSEFRGLEQDYDTAGIVGRPPGSLADLIDRHNCIVSSDLPRSVQSAQALGADFICLSSALFREMNLPYFDRAPIRLPLKHCVILLRSLWFLGF